MSKLAKVKKLVKRMAAGKIPVKIPVWNGELLKGKNALITGGSSGIGYAIAESFLNQGVDKIVITGCNEEKLKQAAKKLGVSYLVWDVSDINMLEFKFNEAVSILGKMDILVNNAGYHGNQVFGTITEEDYDKTFDVNLKGLFFLAQKAVTYMKENSICGHIINVSSASSMKPAWSPYEISKWGVRGFTRGLAREAIPFGIVVNGIAPGPTATPMSHYEEGNGIDWDYGLPINRLIMPEELGNLAVFLASEMGNCVIGDTVFLDGGSGTITMNK